MTGTLRVGLHALGVGTGADPRTIAAVATAAEASGFATLWCGEHVVMVDRPASRYPYSDSGRIAVPADVDWLDPMITLSFIAAATTTIRLATGVLLLPEHNPVVTAKQAASLDTLSGGRLTLGVGIGWSKEEFHSLGVPFARRGVRAAEYAAAMRTLWRDDIATFSGEFVNFASIRVNPKPPARRIPIVLGGNSTAALSRAAAWGDGWYGFNLPNLDAVAAAVTRLEMECRAVGRDPEDLTVSAALTAPEPEDVHQLIEIGVNELVLVEAPPADPARAPGWVHELAARWKPAIDEARLLS